MRIPNPAVIDFLKKRLKKKKEDQENKRPRAYIEEDVPEDEQEQGPAKDGTERGALESS